MIKSLFESSKKWATQYGQIIVWATLIFFAFDLLYWRIIRGYTPPVSYVPWPPAPDWVETLYAARWALRALEVAGGVTLVYLEVIDHSLSRWVKTTLESRWRLIGMLGLMAFLLGSYFIQPGNPGAGDVVAHLATPWALRESIRDGSWFAFWSNYGALGHPFLQFYSTLYYYMVILVNLVVPDFYDDAKITLLGLHIISVYPMYMYTRHITRSRLAGVVASIAWSATFYRYHVNLILGKITVAPFIAFLPLQFYFIERLLTEESPSKKDWAKLALTIGLLIWSHKLYGIWMFGFAGVYLLTHLCLSPLTRKRMWRVVVIGLAHLMGLTTALYQVIPNLTEQSFVLLGDMLNIKSFGLDAPGWEQVMIFQESYLTNWFGGFVGNTIIGFAVLAVIGIFATRYKAGMAIAVQLGAASFMTFAPHYTPNLFNTIFLSIPFGNLVYASGLSSGIYLVIFIFPACVLTGVLVAIFINLLETTPSLISLRHFLTPERVGIICSVILLAELVPLSLWVNIKYPDAYLGDRLGRKTILDSLAQLPQKTARIVDADGMNMFILPMHSGLPGFYGHFPDMPKSVPLIGLIQQITTDLKHGQLQPNTLHSLSQMDFGYIITDSGYGNFDGLERMMETDGAILWQVKDHNPVIAVSQPSGDYSFSSIPPTNRVPITVLDYHMASNTATLKYRSANKAFMQLAYSAYPYLEVKVDGQVVPVTTTALGLIGFWTDAGEHTVTLTPKLSLVRQLTLAISLTAALTLFIVGFFSINQVPYGQTHDE
ncbi:MAG: hypothetical protein HZB17_10480 [Chloroflexi bacterium]|nr:hypothetical protein [Chloroflexota bacterium]